MHDTFDYIALLGPTSFGKTQLLLDIAAEFPERFEIISVDSVQVYKGLDIGSAKPSIAERNLVKHHLVDCCEVYEPYTVMRFINNCKSLIADINKRGKMAILSGGTMLYFHAFSQGIADMPDIPESIRAVAKRLSDDPDDAWQYLLRHDPLSCEKLHPSDKQRVQRALEVHMATQKPISQWQQRTVKQHNMLGHFIILYPDDRADLHSRIARRFDAMLDAGIVNELETVVARCPQKLDLTYSSMRAIGYRQVWQYLGGDLTHDQMRMKAIVATRRYLKRQCTWLKSWPKPVVSFNNVTACYAHIAGMLRDI